MHETEFGELRSLLHREHLDFFDRRELWALIERAAQDPDSFGSQWRPYLEKAEFDRFEPFLVASVDEAQALVPDASFTPSLLPALESCVQSLRTQDLSLFQFERRPPLPTKTLRALVEACPFSVEPAMLDLFCVCDGFTLEWMNDRDADGQPFENDWDVTYRRIIVNGARSYLTRAPAEVLAGVDHEIDYHFAEFMDAADTYLGSYPSEEEIEEAKENAVRVAADFTTNALDLTCSNIRRDPNGCYQEHDDAWMFMLPDRVLRGCSSMYVGSMVLQDVELTIFREVVDSEIAEVVTPGPPQETSVGDVLRALLHAMAKPGPTRSIDTALYDAAQADG